MVFLSQICRTLSIGILFVSVVGIIPGKSQDTLSPKLLNYLSEQQVMASPDHTDARFNGLWWSEIRNRRNTLLFGSKNKSARDANCFVTSMIHNLLAELYLKDSNLISIPRMLEKSLPAINSFRNGYGFNFFPLMDVADKLVRKGEADFYPNGMRRASHYNYKNRFILHGFNIYNDSDDTALGFYANFLSHQIDSGSVPVIADPDSVLSYFGKYRDVAGSGTNLWNWIRGHGSETGAFNSWFPDDPDPGVHPLFPQKGKQYMPYGVNDIDCVVNANILGVLAALGADETQEVQAAANWIIQMIQLEKCGTCAVYYPTGYSLAYAVVKAWERGSYVMEPALIPIMEKIINEQNPDGSWSDRMEGNEVLASLHALNSLIGLRDFADEEIDTIISAGLDFIMSKVHYEGNRAWLDGGIVFSGGSLVKRTHIWTSEAYTTVLLLEAIVNWSIG